MKKENKHLLALILLIITSTLDGLTTINSILYGNQEANILYNYIINNYGLYNFIDFRHLIGFLIWSLLIIIYYEDKTEKVLILSLITSYIWIIASINNIIIIN